MITGVLGTLTPLDIAIVVVGGVVAGVLNYAAAGGSLVSFLVLGSMGVPPQMANATNLVATPASFIAAVPRATKDLRDLRRRWPVFIAAIVGTVAGVYAFYKVPAPEFRRVVPVLLLVATATLVMHPIIQRVIERRHERRHDDGKHDHMTLITVGVFVTSVYAGFFGGGVGVLVLVVLGTLAAWPWLEANRFKNLICLMTSTVGMFAYAATGLVDVPMAILLFVSLGTGGVLGRHLVARLSRDEKGDLESVLRQVVAMGASFGAGVMIAT